MAVPVVTLLLALSGFIFAISARPIWGLCAYCVALLCYPQHQAFSLEIAGMGLYLSRIVMLALTVNIVLRSGLLRHYRVNLMDGLIAAAFLGRIIALLTKTSIISLNVIIVREGGTFIDIILPYMAVRLIIRDKQDLIIFFKALIICGVPLAIMGIYEAITSNNIFIMLYSRYVSQISLEGRKRVLFGLSLYRAQVTFSVSISFGLFFAATAPLTIGLLTQRTWSTNALIVLLGIATIGLVSSMSSAPLLAFMISGTMIACFVVRRYWIALLAVFIAGMMFIEVFSNRHWYEVMTRFAMNPDSAMYRIRLLQKVFIEGGMTGRWLTGFGYIGLGQGNYNAELGFDWDTQDMTNVFIALLVRFGLICVIPYICANVYMYMQLYAGYKKANGEADKWFLWCLSALLISWGIVLMTVGALVQIRTLLYLFFGLTAGLPAIMAAGQTEHPQAPASRTKKRRALVRRRPPYRRGRRPRGA
jgi:hypothetical protein